MEILSICAGRRIEADWPLTALHGFKLQNLSVLTNTPSLPFYPYLSTSIHYTLFKLIPHKVTDLIQNVLLEFFLGNSLVPVCIISRRRFKDQVNKSINGGHHRSCRHC